MNKNRVVQSVFSLGMMTIASSQGHAFSLGDHTKITRRAIQEFDACFPGAVTHEDRLIIEFNDLDEDLNVIRKWFKYSHFFNPTKTIEMRRYDSSIRIQHLEKEIGDKVANGDSPHSYGFLRDFGAVIHHIQDMASPPHVVPVMHGMNDSFENYPIHGEIISSALPPDEICAEMKSRDATPFATIHLQLAQATLQAIRESHFNALSQDEKTTVVSGEAFWIESPDHSFGTYGILGNEFGRMQNTGEAYENFKQAMLRAAVDGTREALYRLLLLRAI